MEAYQEELAKIKTLLRKEPRGMTIKEISHEIGINRNSVAKYMEMLLVSGQAEMKPVGRAKIYFHSQRVPVSALLDYSSEYIMVFNREGRIILLNDAILGWMGHEREALVGKTLDDALGYISDNQDLRNGVLLGLQGQASNIEVPVRTRGETLHFRIKSIPTTFEDGEIGVTVLMEDITERKRMLEELLIKDHAMESSINAFALSDLEGALTYVNPSFLELWGYEDEGEVLGRHAADVSQTEEYASKVIEALRDTGIWRGELTALRKDGSNLVVEMTSSMVKDEKGSPLCMMASFFDVTERKRYEEELKYSEERWRSLVELAPDGIITMDLKGVITSVNTAEVRSTGYSKDEFVGKHFSKMGFVRARDIPKYVEIVGSILKGEIPPPIEVAYTHKDGTARWAEAHISLLEVGGEKIGIQAIMRDITERKKAEESLKESGEWHRAVFEGSLDAIFVTGEDSRIVDVNEAAEILTGYSKEELEGMSIPDLHDAPNLLAYESYFDRIMAGEPITSEAEILRKDGTKVSTEFSNSRIVIQGIPYMHTTARNITERKRMKERLVYLNRVLHTIRNVNQLIAQERDRDRLLKGVTESLVASEGYYNAWIALFDEEGRLISTNQSGLDDEFQPLIERIESGELPACGRMALEQRGVHIIKDPASACTNCHLSEKYHGRSALYARLEHGGRIYGLITASVPEEMAGEEEKALFQEVADDISYALYALKMEEERKWMEEKLREYAENLEDLVEERTKELQEAKTFAEL